MRGYELETLLDSLEYTYKQSWEQTRMLMYTTAQSQSSKHFEPDDLIKFSWDREKELDENDILTQKDIERLTYKMNKIVESNKQKYTDKDGRLFNETVDGQSAV